jgi:N-acetylneuraminic acid mutarotase
MAAHSFARRAFVDPLEPRTLLAVDPAPILKVNFQPDGAKRPAGYVSDFGRVFGRRGNGMEYGWSLDTSATARDGNLDADQRRDTTVAMPAASTWEVALPNGKYVIRACAGDASVASGSYVLSAESIKLFSGAPDAATRFIEGAVEVTVSDGRLTLKAGSWTRNMRLAYVEIYRGGSISWSRGALSPVNRIEAQRAVVGDKLYMLGGYIDNWVPIKRVDVYNVTTNTWSTAPALPIGLTHAATVVDGMKIIMVGGYTSRSGEPQTFTTRQVLSYDTTTGVSSRLPDLPLARGAGGAAIVGRSLYYFTGEKADRTAQPEHWRINLDAPSTGWQRRANFPMPTTHPGAAVVNGQIYSFGGQMIGESVRAEWYQSDCWRYDPASDAWTRLTSLPIVRSHLMPSTVVVDNKVLLIGGEYAFGHSLATVTQYDPATNTFAELTPIPAPRASGSAAYVNGKLVFSTGKYIGQWNDETWVGTLR